MTHLSSSFALLTGFGFLLGALSGLAINAIA